MRVAGFLCLLAILLVSCQPAHLQIPGDDFSGQTYHSQGLIPKDAFSGDALAMKQVFDGFVQQGEMTFSHLESSLEVAIQLNDKDLFRYFVSRTPSLAQTTLKQYQLNLFLVAVIHDRVEMLEWLTKAPEWAWVGFNLNELGYSRHSMLLNAATRSGADHTRDWLLQQGLVYSLDANP